MDPVSRHGYRRGLAIFRIWRRVWQFARCFSLSRYFQMTIKYNTIESKYRTIVEGDDSFMLHSGLTVIPRAAIHISADCPTSVADHIIMARRKGWIKLSSNVYDSELMWETLSK